MAAAIALRGDYERAQLRELARQSEDADQVRRLLALALVYDGLAKRRCSRRRGGFADVSGLGSTVQCEGSMWFGGGQGARPGSAT